MYFSDCFKHSIFLNTWIVLIAEYFFLLKLGYHKYVIIAEIMVKKFKAKNCLNVSLFSV